ncbi:hypothetical protein IT411_03145 [Candidatus Peregrinibacteria bacterium]|nr:hypothetical protein [Candidatus Peregrinibacteria bacterium]
MPELNKGEKAEVKSMEVKAHSTKPIARYTEASLIKELEARGIGRPSTYATIMDTIVRREYVFKQGSALVPTFVAYAVVSLMEKYFTHLVDYTFTAEMEEDLDKIAEGDKKSIPYLDSFYFGKPHHEGLVKLIKQEIDAREVCTINLPDTKEIQVRIGKFGPYIEKGEKKAPIPDDTAPAELTEEAAEKLLENTKTEIDSIGKHPETELEIFRKVGRFGPFLQMGEKGDNGFKMKSIPRFLSPENLTMEQAVEILSWPKKVGDTKAGEEVIFDVGPYGPYIKVGGKNRPLPEGYDAMTLSIEDVEKIIKSPANLSGKGKKGGAPQSSSALKDFGNGIVAKSGRYGIYLTNGKVNAAIPKGQGYQNMTAEEAEELIKKKLK